MNVKRCPNKSIIYCNFVLVLKHIDVESFIENYNRLYDKQVNKLVAHKYKPSDCSLVLRNETLSRLAQQTRAKFIILNDQSANLLIRTVIFAKRRKQKQY